MVLSSLKQENVLKEIQETVVNERTAGMLNPAKHATLNCTENEHKQRMSRYCGQSYIWGMNNRVKCFQKFPKDVYSLYSLLICRDGSRLTQLGFFPSTSLVAPSIQHVRKRSVSFTFIFHSKASACTAVRCLFFRWKNPFICRPLLTFNLF